MSRCKSCGAEIVWIKMRTGKSMPCDAMPHYFREEDGGGITFVTPDGLVKHGEPDEFGERGYISHFATCPNADQHRRRGND